MESMKEKLHCSSRRPWNVTAEHPGSDPSAAYLMTLHTFPYLFCPGVLGSGNGPRRRGVCVLSLLRGCGEDCLCA